ncbi:hypothetical protein D3C72_1006040 [compost metagenome]
MQGHLLRFQAGSRGNRRLVARLELRTDPHRAFVRLQVDNAVERLHRRVRQVGEFVDGFDLLRCLGQLAHVGRPGDGARRFRQRLEGGQLLVAADLFHGARIPLDHQRVAPLLGGPVAVGDDGHAAAATVGLHFQHLEHALDGFRLAGVEFRHLGAKHGRTRHHGHFRTGRLEVDAELLLARRLGGRVQAFHGFADDGKFARILQLDGGGHGLAHGRVGKFAIRRLLSAGAIQHAFRGAHLVGIDLPLRGGGAHQHGARLGADFAVLRKRMGDAARTARHLHAVGGILVLLAGRRQRAVHQAPVGVEFLGDQHGQARLHALAKFQPVHLYRHRVIGGDVQKRVRRIYGLGGSGIGRLRQLARARQEKAQHQAAASHRAGFHETAPRHAIGRANDSHRRRCQRRAQGHAAILQCFLIQPFDTHVALLRPGSWPRP